MRQKRFLSWLLTLCLLLGMLSFPAYAEGNTTKTTISGDGTANKTGTMTITLVIPKKTPAASDLTYTAPSDLTYSGSDKVATIAAASGVTGLGTITVKYYSDAARTTEATPKNVGNYYVGATVAEGDQYAASTAVLYGDGWTFTIAPSTPDAPATPTKASATKNSITLNAVSGCEYSKDGVYWQSGTEFTGLNPGTEYTLYQRVKATANTNASAASSAKISTEADTYAMTITLVIPNTYTVTYKVVNGTWLDGTTADKTETVQSGSKPASVPTGMKASQGFTGGAWDENPADATITGAKTFTYTFTAIPIYTVTVTNDGHGTGSAAPVSGAEGTEVTLNATPAEGYAFKEWQVVSGGVTVKDNKFTIGTANVEIKAVFEQAGDMEDEVIVEPGAPAVSGTNIDEVAAGVVTADEVAAGVKVWVDISPLAEAAVPAGDKALANQAMQGFGGTAGAWIDMSMFKQVTGQNKTAVHQTATAFRFSMKIPDSLKKTGRTFWLLRLHNDKADILATTTGDTLSGETNLFSTYLIAYKDAETP